MTNQGASSSSSSTHSYAYDVFLSYNSADTSAFSCHLYNALCGRGINTFLHEEPVRGEQMSATFLQIYEQSKISLIVFTETFASSTWLDQLAKIIQCKKSKKQLVQPIFYKVDRTNLRDQSVWKAALSKVANLSRWCFLERYESHFIHMVVKEISSTLPNGTSLDVAMHTVGMGSRVREMCKLLKIGENLVHVVGIWGMGGIGKTTIAKSVYNSIARKFEGTCFLANVREMSKLHEGLARLQETLLTDILEDRSLRVTNVYEGMQLIEEKLSRKRVLLVLDDVDQDNQLDILAQTTWFGQGSRIIITTRDRHLLAVHRAETIYRVDELNHDEALELFSWHAFGGQPFGDYAELAMNAIAYAYGLPLLLIVLGSHLRGGSPDKWKETLHSKRARYIGVEDVLRRSYDALDDTVKIAFLDIACFFKGKKMKYAYVQQILDDSGLDFSTEAIQELVEKALITIQNQPLVGEVILMHDLIEDMGKDIVRQESPDEPGERSRLCYHEDVDHVLTTKTGTDQIRGIMVKFPKPDEISMFLWPESLSNMKNLKFFISGDVCLSGDFFHFGRYQNQAFAHRQGRWNEQYDANARRSKQGIHKSNSSMAASEHRRRSDEYELREVALLLPQQVPPATRPNLTPLRVREAGPSNSITEETDSHNCKATAVEASIGPPSPPTPSDCSDMSDIDVEDLDLGRAMSLAEMSYSHDTTIDTGLLLNQCPDHASPPSMADTIRMLSDEFKQLQIRKRFLTEEAESISSSKKPRFDDPLAPVPVNPPTSQRRKRRLSATPSSGLHTWQSK